jgi:hypothetical protein
MDLNISLCKVFVFEGTLGLLILLQLALVFGKQLITVKRRL